MLPCLFSQKGRKGKSIICYLLLSFGACELLVGAAKFTFPALYKSTNLLPIVAIDVTLSGSVVTISFSCPSCDAYCIAAVGFDDNEDTISFALARVSLYLSPDSIKLNPPTASCSLVFLSAFLTCSIVCLDSVAAFRAV